MHGDEVEQELQMLAHGGGKFLLRDPMIIRFCKLRRVGVNRIDHVAETESGVGGYVYVLFGELVFHLQHGLHVCEKDGFDVHARHERNNGKHAGFLVHLHIVEMGECAQAFEFQVTAVLLVLAHDADKEPFQHFAPGQGAWHDVEQALGSQCCCDVKVLIEARVHQTLCHSLHIPVLLQVFLVCVARLYFQIVDHDDPVCHCIEEVVHLRMLSQRIVVGVVANGQVEFATSVVYFLPIHVNTGVRHHLTEMIKQHLLLLDLAKNHQDSLNAILAHRVNVELAAHERKLEQCVLVHKLFDLLLLCVLSTPETCDALAGRRVCYAAPVVCIVVFPGTVSPRQVEPLHTILAHVKDVRCARALHIRICRGAGLHHGHCFF